MNIALKKLQEDMANLINSAQLPMEAKRLVVCEILHKIEVQVEREIAFELQNKQVESQEE